MNHYKQQFLTELDLPQEAFIAAEQIECVDANELIALFDTNRNRFFELVEKRGFEPSFTIFLKLYLEIAYQRYQALEETERQILMHGLERMREDVKICHKAWGIWGILPYEWRFIDRILDGRIRRLHSLEFELKSYPYDITLKQRVIPKGTILLNVHVAPGSNLDPRSIQRSFQAAMKYFPWYYPDIQIFHIESWLVSPKLTQLCEPQDNLYQFQQLWETYEVENSSWAMIERVFPEQDDLPETYASYEEDTRLQRNAKAMLLRGEPLQHAKAILIRHQP